jgi:hypothetical protein
VALAGGLEALAQAEDGVAQVHDRPAPALGPEAAEDLVGMRDAPALAHEVLEQLARALADPGAVDRALRARDARAPERRDPQGRAAEPVRLRAAAAVAGICGPQLEEGLLLRQRRRGDPQRPHGIRVRDDHAHVGERAAGADGERREALAAERGVLAPAAEEVAARAPGDLRPAEEAPGGAVGRDDGAGGVRDEEPEGEAVEDDAAERVRIRTSESGLAGTCAAEMGGVRHQGVVLAPCSRPDDPEPAAVAGAPSGSRPQESRGNVVV